jgi:arginyl-tRNA synthetase
MNIKATLKEMITSALEECFDRGVLARAPLPDFVIEIPNNTEHGHFATNLPLSMASVLKKAPREIAAQVMAHVQDQERMIERMEIAGPGFINFRVRPETWFRLLRDILRQGKDYGRTGPGKPEEKILFEFVSANPTGPLHLGHGRGAALGDTLCRILAFCGHGVAREFYINDAGRQIRLLGESIYSRFKQMEDPSLPFPQEGYHGSYVVDLAASLSGEGELEKMTPEEAVEYFAEKGKEVMLEEVRRDLSDFRVYFDHWTSERDLQESGLLEKTLETMQREGHLYESEGALWIRTTPFGDDKDRVIRKSDGQLTYFASDIAYHLEKRRRGFTRAINIWGADHHGYFPRVQAALKAHGLPEGWLSVLFIQLVKLWKEGREVRMSKRAGSYVTLRELIDEVGVDAVRFVFLTKSHDSALDFDIDLVKKQDSDNPVYYVQYAHARICSIFRKAAEEGFLPAEELSESVLHLLQLNEELTLIRWMSEFPSLLADISRNLEPHRLTYYLTELAALFHRYFNLGNKAPEHRVLTQDRLMNQARLSLVGGVRIVLATGLDLLGVSAPEKM